MSARRQEAMAALDLSLYLVTDRALCGSRGLLMTVEAALKGGITVLQYRAKDQDLRSSVAEAAELATMARRFRVPFIVNDNLDVALAVEADGLHIGQDDLPAARARHLLGPDKILGLSVTRQADLATIDPQLVDYVGLGPVFATSTKPDAAPPLGLDDFRHLRAAIALPVVAIGGIDLQRAAAVIAAGADGLAVVSAICAAADPTAAAIELQDQIEQGRRR
jgi:thiamine-phosphate pyrophosphorylase